MGDTFARDQHPDVQMDYGGQSAEPTSFRAREKTHAALPVFRPPCANYAAVQHILA